MKKLLAAMVMMGCLSACGRKNQTPESDKLAFPPPVVAADAEVKDYPPTENLTNSKARMMEVTLPNSTSQKVAVTDTAKKITKTGDISFETGNLNQTRLNIIYAVQKAEGYISEDNQSKDESSGRKEYVLKLRVPSKNFDKVLDTISGSADKIDSKNISVKDVTTEYIDIKSRLENKRKLESSYLSLLNKASRMSDILQIEAKLTEIRSDIESTQGQLNYMDKQVAYSSLNVTFYSKYVVPSNGDGFAYKLKSALSGGLDLLQNFFFGLISTWPFLAAVALVYLLFARYSRRKKNLSASV